MGNLLEYSGIVTKIRAMKAKRLTQQQFEEMKLRIKYVYENDSASMLSMIFSVDNMADFLNRVEFVQNVSDYDR